MTKIWIATPKESSVDNDVFFRGQILFMRRNKVIVDSSIDVVEHDINDFWPMEMSRANLGVTKPGDVEYFPRLIQRVDLADTHSMACDMVNHGWIKLDGQPILGNQNIRVNNKFTIELNMESDSRIFESKDLFTVMCHFGTKVPKICVKLID